MTQARRVVLRDVTVRRGPRTTLAVGELAFAPGLTALLGPNGAGKTTLMELVVGALAPTTGEVDHGEGSLGHLPQDAPLPAGMRLEEVVDYAAWLQGVPRSARPERRSVALERVRLTSDSRRRLGTLSGGMRRRAALATAIVHSPSLLLLDEPTAGLDPAERDALQSVLREQAAEGTIVVYSTHLLEDVEAAADRVVILDGGEVRFSGTVDELRASGSVADPREALKAGYAASTSGPAA